LNWHLLLNLVADSVILMIIISIAVPWTAASIVSSTVGLALSHAFEAAYIARTVIKLTWCRNADYSSASDGTIGLRLHTQFDLPARLSRAQPLSPRVESR